jgi:hypothetical protein
MKHPTAAQCRVAAAALLALATLASPVVGHAAIVEGADVGIFRTFVDTTTGRVWADLDNHLVFSGTGYTFRFASYGDNLAALTAAGFRWAFSHEVAALTSAIPLTSTAEYDALGNVMGSLSFGETTTLSGYANATDGLASRHYGVPDFAAATAGWGSAFPGTALPTGLNDSGLWAILAAPPGSGGGSSVPVPGTLALAGLGLCAAAGANRRFRPADGRRPRLR